MSESAFLYGIPEHQTVDQAAARLMVPRKVLMRLIEDHLLVGVHRMIKTTGRKGKPQTKYFIPDWWVEAAHRMLVEAKMNDKFDSVHKYGLLAQAAMRMSPTPETREKATAIRTTYRLGNMSPLPPLEWVEVQPEALGIRGYSNIMAPLIRWEQLRSSL